MTPEMAYSQTGTLLTQGFEQCRLIPYRDSKGVWTNGWGNTHGVIPGLLITQEQADADLAGNLKGAVYEVNHYVAIDLSQPEFDALVDFVFNLGAGNFESSTLLRLINVGDLAGAAEQFERWDRCDGTVLAGLLRRRVAEKQEFLS